MRISDFYSYGQYVLYLGLELFLVRCLARYEHIDQRRVKRTVDAFYRWSLSFL